jgi:hypothetical protein
MPALEQVSRNRGSHMAKPNEADLHVHSPLPSEAIIVLSSDVILRRREFATSHHI